MGELSTLPFSRSHIIAHPGIGRQWLIAFNNARIRGPAHRLSYLILLHFYAQLGAFAPVRVAYRF